MPGSVYQTEQDPISGKWSVQILTPTTVACKTDYSIQKAKVTYDFSKYPPIVQVDDSVRNKRKHLLDGFDVRDIWKDVVGNNHSRVADPLELFEMFSHAGNMSLDSLTQNATALADTAAAVLSVYSAQIVNAHFTSTVSSAMTGQISTITTRLQVPRLPTIVLVCALLLAALSTICIIVERPSCTLPLRMDRINDTALILARSHDLNEQLSGKGHVHLDKIASRLERSRFILESQDGTNHLIAFRSGFTDPSTLGNGASNSAEECARKHVEKLEAGADKEVWWRPLPLHPIVFGSISLLPIAIIVALQLLQHRSDTVGIAFIENPKAFLTTLTTRIAPSVIMASITLLYSAVESNILLLLPFGRLKNGKAAPQTTIYESLSGHLQLSAFYHALRSRYWAGAIMISTTFFAGFLTIVISGLFILDDVPAIVSVGLQQVDDFIPKWTNSYNFDGGAMTLLNDMYAFNLSQPPLTFDDLAFPTLKLSSGALQNRIVRSRNPHITVELPALRADLSCSAIPTSNLESPQDFNGTIGTIPQGFISVANASIPLGPYCAANGASISMADNVPVTLNQDTNSTWLASTTDLLNDSSDLDPLGCPSLAFVLTNHSTTYINGTAHPAWDCKFLVCYQLMTRLKPT
ncbi:hypothetical protein K461DRAFT_178460 [Myriangium duriaei CBS 260.36]|uniref:Uncharacterized protein n=1 Tax=Myriangium duriaei CBS 260.36 TaxID=1168546 RepID=A0A9P4IV79_9PEZI|nr:hypothetical protein K461DRAFT_178460 [Myriangium duriaei CBS 260.36]